MGHSPIGPGLRMIVRVDFREAQLSEVQGVLHGNRILEIVISYADRWPDCSASFSNISIVSRIHARFSASVA